LKQGSQQPGAQLEQLSGDALEARGENFFGWKMDEGCEVQSI